MNERSYCLPTVINLSIWVLERMMNSNKLISNGNDSKEYKRIFQNTVISSKQLKIWDHNILVLLELRILLLANYYMLIEEDNEQ